MPFSLMMYEVKNDEQMQLSGNVSPSTHNRRKTIIQILNTMTLIYNKGIIVLVDFRYIVEKDIHRFFHNINNLSHCKLSLTT